MLILTDHDVIGAVRTFRRLFESPQWAELAAILDLQFIEFEDVDLPINAPDSTVWQRSQEIGALLITGNRSSGQNSLDQTIREQATSESLPVLTIGDPQRVIRDRAYTRACATSLLNFVNRIETLRGTGRLFLP
ncbi:ACP S-malonyltransferase [Candidatus Entotheonella serta]|nr:ACP S-malonyltransferase [Candidatus Entotheonella serta]